jgi:hypothetical protein
MREKYEETELEVIRFEAEDIIITSLCPNDTPGEGGSDD